MSFSEKMRLGILVSHPIQYYTPLFRRLAQELDLTVFYAMRQTGQGQAAAGFGVAFDWDIDLLSGYPSHFLANRSKRPGTDHFRGCDTPEIAQFIRNPQSLIHPPPLNPNPNPQSFILDPSSTLPAQSITLDPSSSFDAFLVIGWFLQSHWQAIRACQRHGVPVFVRGDSQLLTPRSRLKQLAKKFLYRWMVRQFNGYLVVGQRARQYLLHYGAEPQRMFLSPHFVDNDWFAAKAAEGRRQKAVSRKQWNIPEDALCVLFCGKFIAKKRPMDLIAAARLLLQQKAPGSTLPKIHLLFVGSGELGAEMRSACHVVFDAEGAGSQFPTAQSSDLCPPGSASRPSPSSFIRSPSSLEETPSSSSPAASFAGFKNQTELPACYAAADLLVLPSVSETWGLSVNEGMACGLPAIVSDAVGCAPDLIEPGVTGETYPCGDVAALAEAIVRFAPRLGREATTAALQRKLESYSVEVATRGIISAVTAAREGRLGR